MIIPKLHYISQGESPKEHLQSIQKACTSGIELVQLNLKNVSEKKLLKLAKEARDITSHYQTRLIIINNYKIAKEIKADGLFIDDSNICPTSARKHLYTWQSVGVIAHTLEDCEIVINKDVDYIMLCPFKATKTSDFTPVLGLKGYTLITEALNTETLIIGFGGITIEDVTDLLETGVSGIAVSDSITSNFDSIKTFNQLLNASSTLEQRHTFDKKLKP